VPKKIVIVDSPMVLVNRGNVSYTVVSAGYALVMDDGVVRLYFTTGIQIPSEFTLSGIDDINITENSIPNKIVFWTVSDVQNTVRPIEDDDASWIYPSFGISMPKEGLLEVIKKRVQERDEQEKDIKMKESGVGTPSILAFTKNNELVAVGLDLQDVYLYFRSERSWVGGSPTDLDGTDSVQIDSSKVADFLDKWDQKDDTLYKNLETYAIVEE